MHTKESAYIVNEVVGTSTKSKEGSAMPLPFLLISCRTQAVRC